MPGASTTPRGSDSYARALLFPPALLNPFLRRASLYPVQCLVGKSCKELHRYQTNGLLEKLFGNLQSLFS